jgi:hypothetical protein
VTRWPLARAFGCHPDTISNAGLHEGLREALVTPVGPGKPALYDGDQAIRWYNAKKARGPFEHKTLADLRAVLREDRYPGARPQHPAPTPTLERSLP